MSGPGSPCGSDIPSILEMQLRKSVELTRLRVCRACHCSFGTHAPDCPVLPGRPTGVTIEQPDQDDESEALQRLKKLLAETREMVVRAEALVASLRAPKDCYQPDRS